MSNCLFCKIANNEEDSLTIYEDDKVRVFLDAFPNSPGHTLIIPKKHYKDFDDIPEETLLYILKIAKNIKLLLEKALNPESMILTQNNGKAEVIKHFHLHLIPKYGKEVNLTREEIFKKIKEADY